MAFTRKVSCHLFCLYSFFTHHFSDMAALLMSGTVVSCGSPAVEETESALETETIPAETEPTLEDEIALQYADIE